MDIKIIKLFNKLGYEVKIKNNEIKATKCFNYPRCYTKILSINISDLSIECLEWSHNSCYPCRINKDELDIIIEIIKYIQDI